MATVLTVPLYTVLLFKRIYLYLLRSYSRFIPACIIQMSVYYGFHSMSIYIYKCKSVELCFKLLNVIERNLVTAKITLGSKEFVAREYWEFHVVIKLAHKRNIKEFLLPVKKDNFSRCDITMVALTALTLVRYFFFRKLLFRGKYEIYGAIEYDGVFCTHLPIFNFVSGFSGKQIWSSEIYDIWYCWF